VALPAVGSENVLGGCLLKSQRIVNVVAVVGGRRGGGVLVATTVVVVFNGRGLTIDEELVFLAGLTREVDDFAANVVIVVVVAVFTSSRESELCGAKADRKCSKSHELGSLLLHRVLQVLVLRIIFTNAPEVKA
jgi:hypothetical protein